MCFHNTLKMPTRPTEPTRDNLRARVGKYSIFEGDSGQIESGLVGQWDGWDKWEIVSLAATGCGNAL